MNDSNKIILSIAVPVFIGFVFLTMYYYRRGDKLFSLLASRHSEYYKQIKEPMYFSDPISNVWAGYYLTLLIFRGVPRDFPKDTEARHLALRSRKIGLTLLCYLIVMLGVIYYQIAQRGI